jgi:hypothetical protein
LGAKIYCCHAVSQKWKIQNAIITESFVLDKGKLQPLLSITASKSARSSFVPCSCDFSCILNMNFATNMVKPQKEQNNRLNFVLVASHMLMEQSILRLKKMLLVAKLPFYPLEKND